jgi:hypothetical protein
MYSVIMLSVSFLFIVMLNAVMLSVIMLNVVTPWLRLNENVCGKWTFDSQCSKTFFESLAHKLTKVECFPSVTNESPRYVSKCKTL